MFKFTYFIKTWLNSRLALGRGGERLAARYLRARGLRILARNVRTPRGEIDIVAMENKTLVIVEVRTQSGDATKSPEQSIRARKKRSVLHAAHWFVRTRKLAHFPLRIDLIAILWPPGKEPEIRHYRNAIRR